jgi:hypothetical protein
MAVAILDSSVYIDHWERELHQVSQLLDSNNAATQVQWSRTEARMLSERSRAIPEAGENKTPQSSQKCKKLICPLK